MEQIEVWKKVIGFESRYIISSRGNLKSINYNNTGQEKLIKFSKNIKGYCQANLHKNGGGFCKKIHRLVAEVFIPNPENKPQINHINGIKDDNRVENLEWVTNLENARHSWEKLNRKPGMLGKIGKLHHNSYPVKMYNMNGEYIKSYESMTLAAKDLNLSSSHISEVVKNKRRQEGGYIWR